MASDLRQAPAYAAYMKSLGWQVSEGAFIKKLPLLPFSIIKIQRASRLPNLAALKKFRPVYLAYEPPLNAKPPNGLKPTTPLLPSKTIVLNLTKSLTQLLAGMHPKTRYNIKKHRLSIKVWRGDKIPSQIIKAFFEIYRQNSQRLHFWGINLNQLNSLIKFFGKNSYLISCQEGGLLIMIYDRVAYYSHNAATIKGRHLFTPTLITWEAIKLSKKLGCKAFDFEGVTDERFPITHKWLGFTRFKKSFGGKEVTYPGNFVKWMWP